MFLLTNILQAMFAINYRKTLTELHFKTRLYFFAGVTMQARKNNLRFFLYFLQILDNIKRNVKGNCNKTE